MCQPCAFFFSFDAWAFSGQPTLATGSAGLAVNSLDMILAAWATIQICFLHSTHVSGESRCTTGLVRDRKITTHDHRFTVFLSRCPSEVESGAQKAIKTDELPASLSKMFVDFLSKYVWAGQRYCRSASTVKIAPTDLQIHVRAVCRPSLCRYAWFLCY